MHIQLSPCSDFRLGPGIPHLLALLDALDVGTIGHAAFICLSAKAADATIPQSPVSRRLAYESGRRGTQSATGINFSALVSVRGTGAVFPHFPALLDSGLTEAAMLPA
jgi:hypothetical protein